MIFWLDVCVCCVNSVVVYVVRLVWCFSGLCTCGVFGDCWIGPVVWFGVWFVADYVW